MAEGGWAGLAWLAVDRSDPGSFFGERLVDSRERNPAGVVRATGVEGENVTVGEWGAEGETGIGERRRWETGV
jgi:hypothetical protein